MVIKINFKIVVMNMKHSRSGFDIDKFNHQLLDRIDSMPDSSSFDPYHPTKKTQIQDSELFDSDYYKSGESKAINEYDINHYDEEEKSPINILTVIIGVSIVILLIVLGYLIITGLM
jgi:hypothetical protein